MYAGSSPASRIDTRRMSPKDNRGYIISSSPVTGIHFQNDYESPISTPDLSIIDHSPSVLARSNNRQARDAHSHDGNLHRNVSSSSPSSILEQLAQQGISPEERRRTVILPTTSAPRAHYSSLPHRPGSLPKRASPPEEGHRRTVDKILSSPSSKRRAKNGTHAGGGILSSGVDTLSSSAGDILFNPSTKMYRDTEEELRILKADRQKIKSMLLELELEADAPPAVAVTTISAMPPASHHVVSPRPQSDVTARTPPPPPQPSPPTAVKQAPKGTSPPAAHQAQKSQERASTARSASSTKSQSGISINTNKVAGSILTTGASRRTASTNGTRHASAANAAPVAPHSTSSSKVSTVDSKGRKMWWQQDLRNTPREVVESHRSRLLGDLRKKHADRLATRDATVSSAQTAQREERAKRRAAMGYHSDPYKISNSSSQITNGPRDNQHTVDSGTFGGAWSNTIEKKGPTSSYLAFLQSGSHPSPSCATPALHRYPTTAADKNRTNKSNPTIPTTATIYDRNSGISKETYAAAIDALSSNSLAAERYCVASVHDRLQQLRLAVGCVMPSSPPSSRFATQKTQGPNDSVRYGGGGAPQQDPQQRVTIATIGAGDIESYLSVPFLSHQLASVASRRPGATQDQWWRLRQDHHHNGHVGETGDHYVGDGMGEAGGRGNPYDGVSQSVGSHPPSSVPYAPSATSYHSHFTNVTAPIASSRFAASVVAGHGRNGISLPNEGDEYLASTLRPSSDSPVPQPQSQTAYTGAQGTRSRLQSAESDSPPWDRAVSGSAGSGGAGASTQPL